MNLNCRSSGTCIPRKRRSNHYNNNNNMKPKRKSCSGAPKKTSPRTDKLLKHEVLSCPSITAIELKYKRLELLHNVSTKIICHQLQKDLGLPGRRAVKKPMLTRAMNKKSLNFCQKDRHWTAAEWIKVMFSDDSTFTIVRRVPKTVRLPRVHRNMTQNLRLKP